jgi:hypothetical protein
VNAAKNASLPPLLEIKTKILDLLASIQKRQTQPALCPKRVCRPCFYVRFLNLAACARLHKFKICARKTEMPPNLPKPTKSAKEGCLLPAQNLAL